MTGPCGGAARASPGVNFVATVSSSAVGGNYTVPAVDDSALYRTETTGGPPAQTAAIGGGDGSAASSTQTDPAAIGPAFDVDPDAVAAIAARIAESGNQAAAILTALRAKLAAAGEPWGTDRLGKAFGHAYTGHANQGFTSMAGLGGALAGIANGLAGHAASYANVDGVVTDAFTRIGAAQDGGSSASGPGTTVSTGPVPRTGSTPDGAAAAVGVGAGPHDALEPAT